LLENNFVLFIWECKITTGHKPTIQSTTVYPLRNGSDIIIPFCRLSNTYDSFIPSTIRQWNSLDPSIRNVDSIAKFKTELRKRKVIGPRKLNIILTQLRCFASFLNYDLFQVNIVSDPSCRCGANCEDSYHFLFDCSHYSNCLKIISFCSYESVRLPQVKSVRSKTQ
jgi:hypothetical protein